ncbi:MAG TPA: L,D-transpeptidase [Polyangia bacterium]
MIRTTLLALVLLTPSFTALARPWKPHPIHIIPGQPLKPEDIKPYTPPNLPPEPPLEPTEVKTVEVKVPEAIVEIRPWLSPMVGNAIEGARLPVRGVVTGNHHGCSSKTWYAVAPFGYVCGRDVKPTSEAPSTESVLKVQPDSRLPFRYVMVLIKDDVKMPLWTTLADLKNGVEPERLLKKGDTIAVEKTINWEGAKFWVSVEGNVIPFKGTMMMGGGSEWHGLAITAATPLPFGWVTPEKAKVYSAPPQKGVKAVPAATLDRRTRVAIVGEQLVGRKKWLKVTIAAPAPPPTFGDIFADSARRQPKPADAPAATEDKTAASLPEIWISADSVNEVRKLERPKTVDPRVTKWIDVDLGEQVLVEYENDQPVYATLVSSGRTIATPMGTYPVWAKVSAITMKNQPYEDKEYFVNKVPWVTFFQWHNAIHGAYWHDRFGVTKSHGCVNVAPIDAKQVFEWVSPPLPPGWSGLRPVDLLLSPTVVVRNSHMRRQFRQDRPIGPPDRELESERAKEADERRAEALPPGAAPAPGTAPVAGAPVATAPATPPQNPSVVPAPTPATPAPAP